MSDPTLERLLAAEGEWLSDLPQADRDAYTAGLKDTFAYQLAKTEDNLRAAAAGTGLETEAEAFIAANRAHIDQLLREGLVMALRANGMHAIAEIVDAAESKPGDTSE